MAIVEDITANEDQIGASLKELLVSLSDLAKDLVVPEHLFSKNNEDGSMASFWKKVSNTIKKIGGNVKEIDEDWGWEEVQGELHAELLGNLIRHYGDDSWSPPDSQICIDDITRHLPPSLPLSLLSTLRPYFAPHPHLSSASRPLRRPTGGNESTYDLHESQPFKEPPAWGVKNILWWSASRLPPHEVQNNLGLVLPPTLVMMDDWDPAWREAGAAVLDQWVFKLDSSDMCRMGLDKLILKSLLHTLSLHPSPPLTLILPITLKVIEHTTAKGEQRMKLYSEVIENKLVGGWTYAPTGLEGRVVLVNLAEELEIMCGVLEIGIVRWLKTIIPHLLEPLQYTPTKAVVPHFKANLRALLCVIKTIRSSGKIDRWRGQVINVLGRLWVQCIEGKGVDDVSEGGILEPLTSLVKEIFTELAAQVPAVKSEEYPHLHSLAPEIFGSLISPSLS